MAQLQIIVVEGRNLKKKDLFSDNDAFVQIYLDKKSEKNKTKVKHNSTVPRWNQTFVFLVIFLFNIIKYFICLVIIYTDNDILHIDVYDEDTIKNDKIGSLIIDLHHLYHQSIYK
jgi:Ca2+-dependent lipid-binding protein